MKSVDRTPALLLVQLGLADAINDPRTKVHLGRILRFRMCMNTLRYKCVWRKRIMGMAGAGIVNRDIV
jgi:hypothetical protein